ncbi:MAG: hypothetical protein ACXWC7_00675 [Chitinophagaceae bacterium]
MKTLKLLFLLLFVPLVFHAQKSLTGLWIGTLSNDSTTVRKDQSFEIALTQYKEKVYGYSRSTFIINDTLYYILKRVKGTIDGEICEVKDDEIISYNFRGRLDKGIKVTTTFRRNLQDSAWYLAGEWKTNKTKKFYSISGKVDLKEETNFEKSKIFPHLEELNIDKEIEFYAASKKPAAPVAETKIAAVNKKEEKKQTTEPDIAKASPQRSSTTIVPEPNRDAGNSSTDIKKQEAIVKKDEPTPVLEDAVAFTGVKKSALPASNIQAEPKKNVTGDIAKPKIKNQGPGVKINEPIPAIPEATTGIKKQDPATIAKANEEKKVITRDLPQPEFKMLSAAAFVEKRNTVPPQILEFKSDSLELKLYDNGEIDGDTVSILLNGEIVLAKQGLKASAIKKTIYIPPGTDELTLVLYAENLGKYPPNTGLLVVHDGEDVYQVRFSADLQQNASVVFRRKK